MHLTRKQSAYIYKCLEYPLLTDAEIAKEAGVSVSQISIWKSKPEFREEYDKIIREQWKDAVKIAKKTMVDLAGNGDRQAAAYILDSNGFKAPEKVEVDANIKTINVSIDEDDN